MCLIEALTLSNKKTYSIIQKFTFMFTIAVCTKNITMMISNNDAVKFLLFPPGLSH